MQIAHASSSAMAGRGVSAGPRWFYVLSGPAAALANEQLAYFMVSWSCGRLDPITRTLLHIVPLVLAALCAVTALLARRALIGAPDSDNEDSLGAARSRAAFMACVGIGLNVIGILVIVAQWIPVWFLNPCSFA